MENDIRLLERLKLHLQSAVSVPELEYYFKGKNKLCDCLTDVTKKEAAARGARIGWTRPIWDVTAVMGTSACYPCHTTMATGVWPDKHKVTGKNV